MHAPISILSLLLFPAGALLAGQADVSDVQVSRNTDGSYRFDVTVRHADQGWEHYADQWQVLALDGRVLGTRVLYHPHVNEQPFTRSLSGVEIPDDVGKVEVRARDSRHGYGGKSHMVELPH
jgi:hypothetical protein